MSIPLARPVLAPSWRRELWQRLTYWWPVKATATMVFMAVFFWAYFTVLSNPSRAPWVMPEIWLDGWVAFTPAAFPVYASLWVYVSLPPAMIGNPKGLLRYGLGMGMMCLLCLAVFWLLPTRVPSFDVDWSQYPSMAFLKGVDSSGNACPSLHVASSVFSAYWLQHLLKSMRAPPGWALASAAFCVAIAWSTMATLQHVALDVLAGAVVGWLFARWSLRPADLQLAPRLQPVAG